MRKRTLTRNVSPRGRQLATNQLALICGGDNTNNNAVVISGNDPPDPLKDPTRP